MRRFAIAAVVVAVLGCSAVSAQTFSSGSTGADGALDLATMNCETGPYAPLPGQNQGCWIQLPPTGVLNYATVNVPSGTTLRFRKNRGNTPVVLLAQGDVVVDGKLGVEAGAYVVGVDSRLDYSQPGPGGFPGGYPTNAPGLGPGGGTASATHGRWVGSLSLVPIVGGSGGTGSGGGGAIVIASTGSIIIAGTVWAIGGQSAEGFGSGGAVRLVANRIVLSGVISAVGQAGNNGIVRLEAPPGSISYTGSCSPAPILSTINPAIVASAAPQLRIVSVGGFLVPDSAGNRKDAADLVLPTQLPDPINVLVEASNIPPGSPVTVSFGTPNWGTAPAVPLAGSLANSTATIGVSGLNRNQLAFLYVQVLFAPPAPDGGAADVPESDRVTQVRLTSAPGAKPQFAFLRRDGAEVPVDRLPASMQAWVSNLSVR